MPRPSAASVLQITKGGRALQAENHPIPEELLTDFWRVVSTPQPLARQTEPDQGRVQSAYLHVPFCFHKCHYCDFYSIVDAQDRQGVFVDRMIAEIEAAARNVHPPMDTVFVGGGTPTLLKVELWRKLLADLNDRLPLAKGGEFTVEANPETVTPELAETLVRGGVNRVSIGCQSFNPTHLKTLERWHDPANVERSVRILRAAGVANINLDLIFAVPGQTLGEWLDDLERALALEPDHMSCYGLVYEPNTPLTVKMKSGLIEPAEQDVEAAMYEATMDRLARAGFEHYEISNWARPDRRCRHNLVYWSNANWWPIGPGAAGHVNGVRWKNAPRLGEYLETGPRPPIMDVERLEADGRVGEELMLGLRLIEGLPQNRIEALLSDSGRRQQRRSAIDRHVENGLLEHGAGRLRLTRRGLMLADSVLCDLI